MRRRKGASVPESHQAFKVAETQTSGITDQSYSLSSNRFSEGVHLLIDKPLFILRTRIPASFPKNFLKRLEQIQLLKSPEVAEVKIS